MRIQSISEWVRRRWIYRKIKLMRAPRVRFVKPPLLIVTIILIAAAIFLLGGGIYDFVEKNVPAIIPGPGQRWTFFIKYNVSEQTLTESLYSMVFYGIGVIGCYLTFKSTRYAYRRRQAWILLSIGVSLILVAFLGCEWLLSLKTA